MNLSTKTFGYLKDKTEIKQFILQNDNGLTVKITNYGAIITAIEMPDKDGLIENIVCGFDDFEPYISDEYLADYPYFGAVVGRSANRIAKAQITIDEQTYQLASNVPGNHLHGGINGFDKKKWQYKTKTTDNQIGVELSYLSPDGEESYPGNLSVKCIYSLNNNNELITEFIAQTDKPTVINLTNHTYFNLTGGKDNILSHELKINSLKITETDTDHIPSGKFLSVKGMAHDFRQFKAIKKDIGILPTGYDNNYVFGDNGKLKHIASVQEKTSGRQILLFSTQPGMQLYSGYWNPKLVINGQERFGSYSGLALETQHYPDANHHQHFPTTILRPAESYHQQTIWKFGIKK